MYWVLFNFGKESSARMLYTLCKRYIIYGLLVEVTYDVSTYPFVMKYSK